MTRIALILLFASLTGCTGTETGNPFRAQLALHAHSSDPTRVAVRVSMGGAVIEQAWLVLGPIAFVEGSTCPAGAAGTDVEALGAADHAKEAATIQNVDLQEGDYCRVVVPLLDADPAMLPAGAPAELGRHSILLIGRTADGMPLRIATMVTRSIEVDAVDAGGFAMTPEAQERAVFLGFDVARLLGGAVDLDTAMREPDGSVIVDEVHNVDLLRAFDANTGGGMELYRDENQDGVIDGPGDVLIARGS